MQRRSTISRQWQKSWHCLLSPLLFKYFEEYNLHKNPFSVHIEHLDPHFSIDSVALCQFPDHLLLPASCQQEAVTLIKYGWRMNGFMWRWGSQKWVKVMGKCWHYITHTSPSLPPNQIREFQKTGGMKWSRIVCIMTTYTPAQSWTQILLTSIDSMFTMWEKTYLNEMIIPLFQIPSILPLNN